MYFYVVFNANTKTTSNVLIKNKFEKNTLLDIRGKTRISPESPGFCLVSIQIRNPLGACNKVSKIKYQIVYVQIPPSEAYFFQFLQTFITINPV